MKCNLFNWYADPYHKKPEISMQDFYRINYIDQNHKEIRLTRLECENFDDMQFRIAGKMIDIRNVFIN